MRIVVFENRHGFLGWFSGGLLMAGLYGMIWAAWEGSGGFFLLSGIVFCTGIGVLIYALNNLDR